jgi:hypothetical protein
MNSEHLFLTSDDPLKPDLLQERVTKFSRLPGGLDLLVDRLLDKNCKADETLAISEILVFYGEVNLKGDEQVKSARAVEAIRQIENDSLADAEHRFPDAPIRRQLILALRKARPDPKSTTDQAASSRSK